MQHIDPVLGFSLELPDAWTKAGESPPAVYTSHSGRIQIQVGETPEELTDPEARATRLTDIGYVRRFDLPVAYESNSVAFEDERRNEGVISAVRDRLLYTIIYDNPRHAAVQAAVRQLVETFRFPLATEAAAVLRRACERPAEHAPSAMGRPAAGVGQPLPTPRPVPVAAPRPAPTGQAAPAAAAAAPAAPSRANPSPRPGPRAAGPRRAGLTLMVVALAVIFGYPLLLENIPALPLTFELMTAVAGGVFVLGLLCAIIAAVRR